jgi:hypothetical protein
MGGVVRPIAGSCNPLAGGNHGGVANDGDKIAVAASLDPNDAKSIVGVLVGDALNQPGQYLPIGLLRLHLHDVHRTGLVAKTLAPGAEVPRDPCRLFETKIHGLGEGCFAASAAPRRRHLPPPTLAGLFGETVQGHAGSACFPRAR